MKTFVLCGAVLAAAAAPAHAQWERVRDRSLQWSQDGTPNLSAPAPRVNGRVDLSGVWVADGDPLPPGIEAIEVDVQFPRHMINVAADLEGGKAPLQPAAVKLLEERSGTEAPGAYCRPMMVVRCVPQPWKNARTKPMASRRGGIFFNCVRKYGRKMSAPMPQRITIRS